MDDVLHCPICNLKLRNLKLDGYVYAVGRTGNFVERTCSTGMNHTLMLFTDTETKKVELLKLSLNPKYSRFLDINFREQRCRIVCLKKNKPEYIEVPKMIYPDFPHLTKLREKVAMYVCFS